MLSELSTGRNVRVGCLAPRDPGRIFYTPGRGLRLRTVLKVLNLCRIVCEDRDSNRSNSFCIAPGSMSFIQLLSHIFVFLHNSKCIAMLNIDAVIRHVFLLGFLVTSPKKIFELGIQKIRDSSFIKGIDPGAIKKELDRLLSLPSQTIRHKFNS